MSVISSVCRSVGSVYQGYFAPSSIEDAMSVRSLCQGYFTPVDDGDSFESVAKSLAKVASYFTLVIPAIVGIIWVLAAIASSLSSGGDAAEPPPYSVE